MAQTGFTPIQLYYSSTTTNAPSAGNLANGELAINITDGKLFYKDNANAVQVIGWKVTPTTAGGTGLTSYTAGDLPYYASGTALSKLGIGASTTVITSSGSAPQWTAQSALSVGTALNHLSNATTGVMQITGPSAASTRVMTIPDANFTVARTDAGQTFTGANTFTSDLTVSSSSATTLNLNLTNTKAAGQGDAYFNITKAANGNSNGIQLLTGANQKWVIGTGITAVNDNFKIYNAATGAIAIEIPVAGTDVTLNTGNLVQGTAAKGINFTANTPAAGMTSQLLNWYEEGTWTPSQGSGLTVVGAFSSTGVYTRVGNLVTVNFSVSGATSVAVGNLGIITSNLPFTVSSVVSAVGTITTLSVTSSAYANSTTKNVYNSGSAISATGTIWVTVTYRI